MGCAHGRETQNGETFDPYDRPLPPADPRSPLTKKQQYSMLASWKAINREVEKTGVTLFIKLFEENEDLRHLFEEFRELHTVQEQLLSEELAAHASKVIHTLHEGIASLQNIDEFFIMVRTVGASHHQVPDFKAENFWKIEKPFLEAAKMTLGDRYTNNIEEIYKKTIKFILENLVKGYEDSTEEIRTEPQKTQ